MSARLADQVIVVTGGGIGIRAVCVCPGPIKTTLEYT
jgi:hypothetical protein|tara:strand:+ start:395 stop:505 length:111 start_codon:yes stop_codon:yes gene_type:complete